MKASKLRPGHIVCPYATLIHLTEVEVEQDGNILVTGRGVFTKEDCEYSLDPKAEVALCTWEGTETEGKAKAEIEAEDYYRYMLRNGVPVTMTVERDEYSVYAKVNVDTGRLYDDTFSAAWRTKLIGRHTTRFLGGNMCRGSRTSKQRKFLVRLILQEVHAAVQDAVRTARFRQERAEKAAS